MVVVLFAEPGWRAEKYRMKGRGDSERNVGSKSGVWWGMGRAAGRCAVWQATGYGKAAVVVGKGVCRQKVLKVQQAGREGSREGKGSARGVCEQKRHPEHQVTRHTTQHNVPSCLSAGTPVCPPTTNIPLSLSHPSVSRIGPRVVVVRERGRRHRK